MSFIAIDLDGTLLNGKNEISEENRKAIRYAQEQGFEVVISTGRAYFDVQTICNKAGISPYIVGTNGATIHSKDGKNLFSIPIPRERVESIIKWLEEQDFYIEVFTDKAIYTLKKRREHFYHEIQHLKSADLDRDQKKIALEAERQFDQFGYVLVENYPDIIKQKEEVFNIVACSFDQKKLAEGWNRFNLLDELEVVSSADHNIEITNESASKGNALEKIAYLLDVSLDQSMAIGDNNNDLSMFRKVGYSVAMENAKEDIKAVCTTTTLKNDENGVAHAIYQFMENFALQK